MKLIRVFVLLVAGFGAYAQQDTVYNPNSTERIAFYEQLYRYRVWRTIDLQEKQNMGFKSAKSDLVKFILENVKSGKLLAYDDSLKNIRKPEEILVSNTAVMQPAWDANKFYVSTEQVSYNGVNYSSLQSDNKGHVPTDAAWWEKTTEQTEFYSAAQIPAVTLIEDVIFDKRRSRLYYDIQAIGILAQRPGTTDLNPIAFLYYKDIYKLVDQFAHSKSLTDRDMVQWRNRYNPAENRTFNDAFKLRLFHGVIDKVDNPDDRSITEIYRANNRSYWESVFAPWEEEMKLMEKEHNLWEY